jgi:hypothetical protein
MSNCYIYQGVEQNMNKNQVIIKILGELHPVMRTLRTIESLYPIYIEGKINQNDNDSGVHVFLTIPTENSCFEAHLQSQPQNSPAPTTTELTTVEALNQ